MTRLRGIGLGSGTALGTAAVVRMRNGYPLTPSIPPRIAEMLTQRRLDQTPDIILIADDYQIALDIAAAIRWGNVVGIASALPSAADAQVPHPAVTGAAGLLETVEEDMLLIVDAERGIVTIDPDPAAIGQYTAESNRLAPKRRLYLDDTHLPAHTLDGHTLQVLTEVHTGEDVALALDNGADALLVPFDVPLLPDASNDSEQRQSLLALVQLAASKPLIILDRYALAPMVLLEAALKADLTVTVPLMAHLDGYGVGEFSTELIEGQADCLASDAPCDMPRLGISLTTAHLAPHNTTEAMAYFVDKLAVRGVTRIFLTDDNVDEGEAGTENDSASRFGAFDPLDAMQIGILDDLIAAANAAMLPVFVPLRVQFAEGDAQDALKNLIGAGVAGLIVPLDSVAQTKADTRELNFSECREALTALLSQH